MYSVRKKQVSVSKPRQSRSTDSLSLSLGHHGPITDSHPPSVPRLSVSTRTHSLPFAGL